MAKPVWLKLSTTSGSGNGVIGNSADVHTGRVARIGVVTVQGAGISTPSTYNVQQTAKAEFVSFDNGSEMSAPKAGGTLTVTGVSNSSKLTFSIVEGGKFVIELPAKYAVDGAETSNGTVITSDPGANAEFAFSIELDIPANLTINERKTSILVTANGAQTAQIAIVQAAGDPTLVLDKHEITIPQAGTPVVMVTVTANCPWTVS